MFQHPFLQRSITLIFQVAPCLPGPSCHFSISRQLFFYWKWHRSVTLTLMWKRCQFQPAFPGHGPWVFFFFSFRNLAWMQQFQEFFCETFRWRGRRAKAIPKFTLSIWFNQWSTSQQILEKLNALGRHHLSIFTIVKYLKSVIVADSSKEHHFS